MPATKRAHEHRLFHSCRILFGSEVDVGWDFLFYIQLTGVKRAYREKALLTHPDRALQRGEGSLPQKSGRFIEARDAYEHLREFIRTRHTLATLKRPPFRAAAGSVRKNGRGTRPRAGRNGKGYFYSDPLPKRTLLAGEFLFYSGAISWETLIKAIVWQRRQRPRLGDMAAERGWVRPGQTSHAARRKGPGVPIGEALIRYGLLSRGQVRTLVWRQRRMQKALGEYFLSRRLVTEEGLDSLLRDLAHHNRGMS